jgi:hypothetical protein
LYIYENTKKKLKNIFFNGKTLSFLDIKTAVYAAVKMWEQETCIRFREDAAANGDYLNIIDGSG